MIHVSTRGIARLSVTAGMIGVSGVATMLGILAWSGEMQRAFWWSDLMPFLIPAGVGAACAGAALSWFFGRPGPGGWFLALTGALLATGLGALLGGAIFATWQGDTFGEVIYVPLVVLCSLATPVTGPLWTVTMSAAHLVSTHLRKAM